MLFSALIWRPLRNDAGRTLLSLLAIALGVAVVVAIRVANRSAVASFQKNTRALSGGADLLVTGPQPLPASLLPRLFPLNAQAETLPYLDRRAYNPAADDTLEILGIDLLASAAVAIPAQSSSGLNLHAGLAAPDRNPPLLLPAAYASLHHLHPGGTLDLSIGGRIQPFSIAAILPATQGPSQGDIALLDLPAAVGVFEPQRAAAGDPVFDGLRVILASGANPGSVARGLRALIPAVDTVAPPSSRNQQDQKMLAAFRANLAALAYASLLIGLFLIYNTVSISVVRRRTAIATLRALGAARRQVLILFLGEGLVLAVCGGVLGWLLGWLLARLALDLVQRTINNLYAAMPHSAVLALSAADLWWALALAASAGLLAAWGPARQAAGVAPAHALRAGAAEAAARAHAGWGGLSFVLGAAVLGAAAFLLAKVPEPGRVPVFGFASALTAVLAVACLAPPLLAALLPRLRRGLLAAGHFNAGLAAGGLAGALRRSSILTAALAIAIGVMLGVAIMVGSFRQTVKIWIGQQLQADVFVRAADWDRNRPSPLLPALVAGVASTPGVATVEASHTQSWAFRGEPIFINTRWPLRGNPGVSSIRDYLAGGPGPVEVSEPFARRFHLWAGSHFTLQTARGPQALVIAGVYYDYASDHGEIVLSPAAFARGFGAPSVTELGLYTAPGISPADVRRRLYLRPNAAALVVNDNRSLRAEAMQVFDQTFRITYALEAITLIVAILGVGNTLLAVVLERGREFAILRFLGATRGQVRAILLAESGLIATAALTLGWTMGGVLALVLVRVINVQSFGWTIQFHFPFAFLLPASAAVWIATLAAGWLPAGAAQRQATPAALEVE